MARTKHYRNYPVNGDEVKRNETFKLSVGVKVWQLELFNPTTKEFKTLNFPFRNKTAAEKATEEWAAAFRKGNASVQLQGLCGDFRPTGYVVDDESTLYTVYYIPKETFYARGHEVPEKNDRGRTIQSTFIECAYAGRVSRETIRGTEYHIADEVYADYRLKKFGHIMDVQFAKGKWYLNPDDFEKYAVKVDKPDPDGTPDDFDGGEGTLD